MNTIVNASSNVTNITAGQKVIAKWDTYKQAGVIFFIDGMDKGELLFWRQGMKEVELCSLQYYHLCTSLSITDQASLCLLAEDALRMTKHSLVLMQRLPRVPKKPKDRLKGQVASRLNLNPQEAALVATIEPKQDVFTSDVHKGIQKLAGLAQTYNMDKTDTSVDVVAAIRALQAEVVDKLEAVIRTLVAQGQATEGIVPQVQTISKETPKQLAQTH